MTWRATDRSGAEYEYSTEPRLNLDVNGWQIDDGEAAFIGHDSVGKMDWQQSKTEVCHNDPVLDEFGGLVW